MISPQRNRDGEGSGNTPCASRLKETTRRCDVDSDVSLWILELLNEDHHICDLEMHYIKLLDSLSTVNSPVFWIITIISLTDEPHFSVKTSDNRLTLISTSVLEICNLMMKLWTEIRLTWRSFYAVENRWRWWRWWWWREQTATTADLYKWRNIKSADL